MHSSQRGDPYHEQFMARVPLLILGPTAGGKTRLAIDLARALPGGGECVSADSMQVYRSMDIGTAKPTPAERDAVPHHLIDIVDPDGEPFTVDQWLTRAEEAIASILERNRVPIIVGGTNLYVQALLYGLFSGPPVDQELRDHLRTRDDEELHAHLARCDPEACDSIHPNDRRRMIRAIEVFETSGMPISSLQQQWSAASPRMDVTVIGLDWPAESINRRINRRVKSMMNGGLWKEVAGLHAEGKLGMQAREGLGYRQVIDAIEGRTSRDQATEQIRIRTRRYAKQQRTWLRRFRATLPRSLWIDATQGGHDKHVQQALDFILPDFSMRDGILHGGQESRAE